MEGLDFAPFGLSVWACMAVSEYPGCDVSHVDLGLSQPYSLVIITFDSFFTVLYSTVGTRGTISFPRVNKPFDLQTEKHVYNSIVFRSQEAGL